MNPNEVFRVKDAVFVLQACPSAIGCNLASKTCLYLSGCVDNLSCEFLPLVFDHFAEGVLDSGIVAVNEVAVDILNGQG